MSADTTAALPAFTTQTLRVRALRGLRSAGLTSAGKTLVDAGTQLLLARWLLPEAFGLFAAAQAVTGFVSCLTDLSGQRYLLRMAVPEAVRERLPAVFTAELLLGILVAMGWLALAPAVLTQLGQADSVPIAQLLAVWIVGERLLLPRVLLESELQFEPVNRAQFAGVAIGAGAAIGVAAGGLGAWALPAGLIVRTLATALLLFFQTRWLPRLCWDRAVWRSLAHFGLPVLGANALVFAYTNVDYLIAGSLLGPTALGLYYAAYRYPHYLNQFAVVLSSVAFPSLARATGDAQVRRALTLLTRYCALLSFLPALLLWLEGEAIVHLVLGERWIDATFAFQCFMTLAACRLTFRHWGDLATLRGHTRLHFFVSLWNLGAIGAAAYFGAYFGGLEGAALGVTVAALGTLVYCCVRFTPRFVAGFRYAPAVATALHATFWGAAAAGGVFLLGEPSPLRSALAVAAATVAYGIVGLRRSWGELRDVLRG